MLYEHRYQTNCFLKSKITHYERKQQTLSRFTTLKLQSIQNKNKGNK